MDEQDRNRLERDQATNADEVIVTETVVVEGTVPANGAMAGGTTEDAAQAADNAALGGEHENPATGGRREWNRREWSGEADGDREPARWNKHQWAGEAPDPNDEEPGGRMPPGEGGPQGLGHNPGEQHWVPDDEDKHV